MSHGPARADPALGQGKSWEDKKNIYMDSVLDDMKELFLVLSD